MNMLNAQGCGSTRGSATLIWSASYWFWHMMGFYFDFFINFNGFHLPEVKPMRAPFFFRVGPTRASCFEPVRRRKPAGGEVLPTRSRHSPPLPLGKSSSEFCSWIRTNCSWISRREWDKPQHLSVNAQHTCHMLGHTKLRKKTSKENRHWVFVQHATPMR